MSEDAHLSGEVCGRMRNHETRAPKLCYFDAYHDKELPNGIRKFNLDAPICVVRLILSHGIDYVLITFTRCPYLKQEGTSTGYFPQGACPVGGGTAWPCANPSPQLRLGLQSLWRRGPRLRTCHMEPRAQTVVMWNDSSPCMGTKFGDSPGQMCSDRTLPDHGDLLGSGPQQTSVLLACGLSLHLFARFVSLGDSGIG